MLVAYHCFSFILIKPMMPGENVDELQGKEVSVPVKPAKQQQRIKALPDVIASHIKHLDIDSIFQPTMDDRLKGNSLTVLNKDLDTTLNSDGSQLSKPSTADQHLSMLMEQGNAMVDLLQSSVDGQKKGTDVQ